MRYSTPRSKATQRRDAKYAKRKHLRRVAVEEIAAGVVQLECEREDVYAARVALQYAAYDAADCDDPNCGCHARKRAAIEELNALLSAERNT